MIAPTESDIGRRVIYDARPIIAHTSPGRITGLDGHNVLVLFDGSDTPIRVFSNLRWGDK